jgi:hypothetical protein
MAHGTRSHSSAMAMIARLGAPTPLSNAQARAYVGHPMMRCALQPGKEGGHIHRRSAAVIAVIAVTNSGYQPVAPACPAPARRAAISRNALIQA